VKSPNLIMCDPQILPVFYVWPTNSPCEFNRSQTKWGEIESDSAPQGRALRQKGKPAPIQPRIYCISKLPILTTNSIGELYYFFISYYFSRS